MEFMSSCRPSTSEWRFKLVVGDGLHSLVIFILNVEFLLKKAIGRILPAIKFRHQKSNSESELVLNAGEVSSAINLVDSIGTQRFHLFQPRKVVVKKNVILNSKSGMAYENGNKLIPRSSSWPINELIRDSYNGSDIVSKLSTFKVTNETNYSCLPSNGFYHWIIEDLPRYLILREYMERDIKTLVYHNAPQYVRDFCEMFGIEFIEVPRVFLVPSFTFGERNPETGIPNPYDIKILRDTLVHKDNTKSNEKLYVSRTDSTRSPSWEMELSLKLENLGWRILHCERMHLKEQIDLFQSAETICGVHGAGLVGMVWAKPGTHIIELNDNFRSDCFNFLAQLMGHRMSRVNTAGMTLSEIEEYIIR